MLDMKLVSGQHAFGLLSSGLLVCLNLGLDALLCLDVILPLLLLLGCILNHGLSLKVLLDVLAVLGVLPPDFLHAQVSLPLATLTRYI